MKAVTFLNRSVSMIDASMPLLSAGDVMVKTAMAGICATDIALFNGYHEFSGIPGHEFVGIVTEAPDFPELSGKRVVADINCGCGMCVWCRSGDMRHCPDRTVIGIRGQDGAFAEFCAIPAHRLHIVPDTIDTMAAVFAEPLAAALEITQQVHIQNAMKIAVLGDGPIGILCALALHHNNDGVRLAGRHADKLAIAGRRGVRTVCMSASETPADALQKLGEFDLVVDATGSPEGIHFAVALTRPEGTVVLKTTSHEKSEIALAEVAVKELTLIGSRCGDLSLSLHYLENQWIDVIDLIEDVYDFSEFQTAFDRARQKGSKKVLLRF